MGGDPPLGYDITRMDAKGLVLLLGGRPVVAMGRGWCGIQAKLGRHLDVLPAPVPAGWAMSGMGSGQVVMTTAPSPVTRRRRLPNCRPSETRTLTVGGQQFMVMAGFDPEDGRPREVFLAGAKDGTDMAAILDDASVVISVALQHRVPAALAKSVARVTGDGYSPSLS